MKKLYIIYDGRATDSTEDAAVMECCDSLKEAEENAPDHGDGCCIWSYDIGLKNSEGRNQLINEKLEKIMPF